MRTATSSPYDSPWRKRNKPAMHVPATRSIKRHATSTRQPRTSLETGGILGAQKAWQRADPKFKSPQRSSTTTLWYIDLPRKAATSTKQASDQNLSPLCSSGARSTSKLQHGREEIDTKRPVVMCRVCPRDLLNTEFPGVTWRCAQLRSARQCA